MKSQTKMLRLAFIALLFFALQVSVFSQEEIKKPTEVKGNKGINTFANQAFAIYDSTLTIPAQVDSLNICVAELEKSVKQIKKDTKETVSTTISDTKDTKISSAKSDVDSTKQATKDDVDKKIEERNKKISLVESSSKEIKLSIETLKKRTEEMIVESPKNSADAVKNVKVGLSAAKEIKQIKNNAKVSLKALNESKKILIAQSKKLVEINKRIIKLKSKK